MSFMRQQLIGCITGFFDVVGFCTFNIINTNNIHFAFDTISQGASS